jgi:hypothetical protein
MSIVCTCDWCGETVPDDDRVTLRTERLLRNRLAGGDGYVGHYHEECFDSVREALHAAHDIGQDLGAIPSAGDGPLDEPIFEEGRYAKVRDSLEATGLTLHPVAFEIKQYGILTVGALIQAVETGELLKIRGIGPKTFAQVHRNVNLFIRESGLPATSNVDGGDV